MNTSSTQRLPLGQTVNTADRQIYEALPQSQRRQRSATSERYKAKTQGVSRSWELDGWLHPVARLNQQASD